MAFAPTIRRHHQFSCHPRWHDWNYRKQTNNMYIGPRLTKAFGCGDQISYFKNCFILDQEKNP